MATSITLATGPLTATLTTQDDTAAQLVLVRFAHAAGAAVEMPAQEKLEFVTRALADYMIRIPRERNIQEESANKQEEAITNVHW